MAMAARAQSRIPCVGMNGLVSVSPPQDGHETMPPLEVAAGWWRPPPARACWWCRTAASRPVAGSPPRTCWRPRALDDLGSLRGGGLGHQGRLRRCLRGRALPAAPESPEGARRHDRPHAAVDPREARSRRPARRCSSAPRTGPCSGRRSRSSRGSGIGAASRSRDRRRRGALRRERTRGIEIDGDHLVSVTVEPADFGLDSDADPELPLFGPPEDGLGASDNPALCEAAGAVTRSVLAGEPGAAQRDAPQRRAHAQGLGPMPHDRRGGRRRHQGARHRRGHGTGRAPPVTDG